MVSSQQSTLKILRMRDLVSVIGISKSGIYGRLDSHSPQYDETFPKPVQLGGRAVGFVEAEVQAWLKTRMDARY